MIALRQAVDNVTLFGAEVLEIVQNTIQLNDDSIFGDANPLTPCVAQDPGGVACVAQDPGGVARVAQGDGGVARVAQDDGGVARVAQDPGDAAQDSGSVALAVEDYAPGAHDSEAGSAVARAAEGVTQASTSIVESIEDRFARVDARCGELEKQWDEEERTGIGSILVRQHPSAAKIDS
jgi:hypothetical protein